MSFLEIIIIIKPLIVISILLIVITVLLLIADKLLVSYGECKIKINKDGETREITVQGGDHLLIYLNKHGENISSSCAGKASCGYCKIQVDSGGGQILPTEEIFMSRKELLNNIRLACQVKVKQDVEITIPDYIETIKEMVKNNKFDTKKKWLVTID